MGLELRVCPGMISGERRGQKVSPERMNVICGPWEMIQVLKLGSTKIRSLRKRKHGGNPHAFSYQKRKGREGREKGRKEGPKCIAFILRGISIYSD